jgi:predicted ATPase/class 3 adenylate cyclase
MSVFPVGTVTFLFTDVVGSTRLWEEYPDIMRRAMARHDNLLRVLIAEGNGAVVKSTGDGIHAAFATAPDALNVGLAIQRAFHTAEWEEPVVIKVRMAIHTGAAELRDGDYFGSPVNRAARLMAAGHGGQLLISLSTHELVRDHLPEGVTLRDLGLHRLKDLARPEQVFQVVHPALDAEFPALKTLDNPELKNNLPRQLNAFIGRETVLSEVTSLLTKTKLLTLTGAGGFGKTRLSLQVAADVLEQYPDGVWLVELAPVTEPSRVLQTVAAVLGVKEKPGQTLEQLLLEYLPSKHLLLLLDNCEHQVNACAGLATAILRSCSHVTLLATSREALGIAGERVYRVPSLSLPDPRQPVAWENLSQYEAVRLFIERALLVKSDFAVTNDNAPALAQICSRLDGIPLAIELAAARVRSLSLEDINRRLDSSLQLLTGGNRMALPRQQTLRALIGWSFDLLGDHEKLLFARLAVFPSSWTLEAAENIGSGVAPSGTFVEDWEVMDLLFGLVDKSLVAVEEDGTTTRYRMLETVRQFAAEKFREGGEVESVRGRHLLWFTALAEEACLELEGADQAAWLRRIESEHDNFRAALGWETSDAEAAELNLRIVGSLWRFWAVRGYFSEGRTLLRRALAHPGIAPRTLPHAKALNAAGLLAYRQGEIEAAREFYEESLAIRREHGERKLIAGTLDNLGIVARAGGDFARAQALHEEGLVLWREAGDPSGIANSLSAMGLVAYNQGDYDRARKYYEESASLQRGLGNLWGLAGVLNNLGLVVTRQEDSENAPAIFEECASIFRELNDRSGIATALVNLGFAACQREDYVTGEASYRESLMIFRDMNIAAGIIGGMDGMASSLQGLGKTEGAVLLWGANHALREQTGMPVSPHQRAVHEGQMEDAKKELGEARFAELWAEGVSRGWKGVLSEMLDET